MVLAFRAKASGHGDDGAGPEAKRNVTTREDACHHHAIPSLDLDPVDCKGRRPASAFLEHRFYLRPAEPHRRTDLAAEEPESGQVTTLEAIEHGGGGEAEQSGELSGG